MRVALAGTNESSARLEPELERAGIEVERLETSAAPSDGSEIAALAAGLVAIDAQLAASELAAVVLSDESDAALAAALVATKLQIPVLAAGLEAGTPARAPAGNGALIAWLADASPGPDPEALVASIAAPPSPAAPGGAAGRA